MNYPEHNGDIFNHPDLVELERYANDPETIRLMKEVREFDEALRNGRLTDITDVARVTAELNERWVSHIGEQIRLSGTIYVSDDESTEVRYVHQALMYFGGFTVVRTEENGRVDRHARYALSMQKDGNGADVEDNVTFTLDASAHVAFPGIMSVDRMKYLAYDLIEKVDQLLTAHGSDFAEAIGELSNMEFLRNIPMDDMYGVYTALAHYLNDAVHIDDLMAVNCDVSGIVYRHDSGPEPHVAEGNHTIVSPTFFFWVHDESFVELCLMGETVHRGRGTTDAIELTVPLTSMTRINPVGYRRTTNESCANMPEG